MITEDTMAQEEMSRKQALRIHKLHEKTKIYRLAGRRKD